MAIKRRISAADRQAKLIENAVAISADVHGSKKFLAFARKHGERLQGCTGVYDLVRETAEALTEYEIRKRIDWGVDEEFPEWIETIEVLAGAILETGDVPNVSESIKRIPR